MANSSGLCAACSVGRVCVAANITGRNSGPVILSSGDCGLGSTVIIETLEAQST